MQNNKRLFELIKSGIRLGKWKTTWTEVTSKIPGFDKWIISRFWTQHRAYKPDSLILELMLFYDNGTKSYIRRKDQFLPRCKEVTLRCRHMAKWIDVRWNHISRNLLAFLTCKATSYMYEDIARHNYIEYAQKRQSIGDPYKTLVKYRAAFPGVFYEQVITLNLRPGIWCEIIEWELNHMSYFKIEQEIIDKLFKYIKNDTYERRIKRNWSHLSY
jgi:hypothetical protein